MAIVKPMTAYPNGNTIDMTERTNFSVQIQGGGSVVVAYEVITYDAKTGFETYRSPKMDISTPLVAGDILNIEMPSIREEGIISLAPLMEGDSYFWKVRLYQSNPTMYVTTVPVIEETMDGIISIPKTTAVKPGMYFKIGVRYIKIVEYDAELGIATIDGYGIEGLNTVDVYSDFVESIGFPFVIKTTPKIDILFNNAKMSETNCFLDLRTGVFYGEYIESSHSDVRWYEYKIYNSELDIVDCSGKLKNSSLKYEFSNFQNGRKYYIQLGVMNEDDVFVETSYLPLTVKYSTFALGSTVDVSTNCDGTMLVEWVEDRLSTGIATGSYTYEQLPVPIIFCLTDEGVATPQVYYKWNDVEKWDDNKAWTEDVIGNFASNKLKIISGEVYYNEINGEKINIDTNDFTICTDVYLPRYANGTILALTSDENNYRVTVSNGVISYSINGVVKTTKSYYQYNETEFKIAITPTKAVMAEM